jgi:hypothetical protein
MGEVPVSKEHAFVKLGDAVTAFYKVVLEAPNNTLNKWIVKEDGK